MPIPYNLDDTPRSIFLLASNEPIVAEYVNQWRIGSVDWQQALFSMSSDLNSEILYVHATLAEKIVQLDFNPDWMQIMDISTLFDPLLIRIATAKYSPLELQSKTIRGIVSQAVLLDALKHALYRVLTMLPPSPVPIDPPSPV